MAYGAARAVDAQNDGFDGSVFLIVLDLIDPRFGVVDHAFHAHQSDALAAQQMGRRSLHN